MSECCVREGFAATGRLSVGPLVSTPAPRSTPISPPSPPSSTSYECRHAPPPWGGRPSPARPKQSPNRCTIGGRRLPPKQRGGRGEKGTSVGRHPNGVTPSPLAATRRLPAVARLSVPWRWRWCVVGRAAAVAPACLGWKGTRQRSEQAQQPASPDAPRPTTLLSTNPYHTGCSGMLWRGGQEW